MLGFLFLFDYLALFARYFIVFFEITLFRYTPVYSNARFYKWIRADNDDTNRKLIKISLNTAKLLSIEEFHCPLPFSINRSQAYCTILSIWHPNYTWLKVKIWVRVYSVIFSKFFKINQKLWMSVDFLRFSTNAYKILTYISNLLWGNFSHWTCYFNIVILKTRSTQNVISVIL